VASPHQSDLKNDHLPKRLRQGGTRNNRRKRPRTRASVRLATSASIASAILNSADVEEPKSQIQITATDEEWELRDTDRKMADDGSADDFDDEDFADMSDAAGSKRRGRPRSLRSARSTKRVNRTFCTLAYLTFITLQLLIFASHYTTLKCL
jgi:hypothetical protein